MAFALACASCVATQTTGLGPSPEPSPHAGTTRFDAGVDDGADAFGADDAALDVGIGPWTAPAEATAPVPMDNLTVFAFSQVGTNQSDPQVTARAPGET